jgi:hypothetical protein
MHGIMGSSTKVQRKVTAVGLRHAVGRLLAKSLCMSHFHLFAKDSTPTAPTPQYVVSVSIGESIEEGDETILFPPCHTADEIDAAIDRLITQLNAVRHKGKEKITDRLRE